MSERQFPRTHPSAFIFMPGIVGAGFQGSLMASGVPRVQPHWFLETLCAIRRLSASRSNDSVFSRIYR
jgi:hypothetical protein